MVVTGIAHRTTPHTAILGRGHLGPPWKAVLSTGVAWAGLDGVQLADLDEYDELVRQKIEHSANSGALRRLFSTISFDQKLLKQNAFIAVVAEYLKMLASSFCRSK